MNYKSFEKEENYKNIFLVKKKNVKTSEMTENLVSNLHNFGLRWALSGEYSITEFNSSIAKSIFKNFKEAGIILTMIDDF